MPSFGTYDMDEEDGHIGLQVHTEAECRRCNTEGTEETPMHLVFKCENAWYERWLHFGTPFINDTIVWKPKDFIGVFKKMDLED